MINVHDIPGRHRATFRIPAHAAADPTTSHVIFAAPFSARIRKVALFFAADVTGQNTNTFNLNLVNRGTDGTGTTVLASRSYTAGVNESAYVESVLYEPTNGLSVSAGTVLDLERELVGTGMDSPNIWGYVEYEGA